jgi:hypothetical protein
MQKPAKGGRVPTRQGVNQAAQRPVARPIRRKGRTWPPPIVNRTGHLRSSASSGATVSAPPVSYDLENIIKGAGALALGLYVLGLLIVNAYLFRLGASDFTLVRPRFVYTGALIVAITLITLTGPALGTSFVWQRHQRGLPTFSTLNIQMLVMSWLLPLVVLLMCFLALLAIDSAGIPRMRVIGPQAGLLSLSTFVACLLSL